MRQVVESVLLEELAMYEVMSIESDVEKKDESIGARKKFWFKNACGERWMFKRPRDDSGEHWAEKIACEVAGFLGIECTTVELATYKKESGTITKSFTCRKKSLVLGNVLLWGLLQGSYDKEKMRRQNQHSVENILSVFDQVATSNNATQKQFVQYLLLDTIIGNTDRHHENWGFLFSSDAPSVVLAPTYDHASSLGRELTDNDRRRKLSNKAGIAGYADHKRARGAIYLKESDASAAKNIVLMHEFCKRCGIKNIDEIVSEEQLKKLADEKISQIINKIPQEWMSDEERQFAEGLVRHNIMNNFFHEI